MIKVGKFEYEKSTRKGKKLMVKVGNKTLHFGDSNMEQYKDKTGIWKSKDHGDSKRRKSYLARAKGIRDKEGILTWKNSSSPNFHSVHVLW
tara:strand:+ start:282 stop:554 length:273 start_codon:yes stop_codon:yes gene_type:complete